MTSYLQRLIARAAGIPSRDAGPPRPTAREPEDPFENAMMLEPGPPNMPRSEGPPGVLTPQTLEQEPQSREIRWTSREPKGDEAVTETKVVRERVIEQPPTQGEERPGLVDRPEERGERAQTRPIRAERRPPQAAEFDRAREKESAEVLLALETRSRPEWTPTPVLTPLIGEAPSAPRETASIEGLAERVAALESQVARQRDERRAPEPKLPSNPPLAPSQSRVPSPVAPAAERDEPRLVIGRMRVEVVPTSAPAERGAPVTYARRAAAPSRSAASSGSVLRFGIGQI